MVMSVNKNQFCIIVIFANHSLVLYSYGGVNYEALIFGLQSVFFPSYLLLLLCLVKFTTG